MGAVVTNSDELDKHLYHMQHSKHDIVIGF